MRRTVFVFSTMFVLGCSMIIDKSNDDDDGDWGDDGSHWLEPGGDADGDGLSNEDEEELGTDPENPDSDGDGFEDGTEIEDGTNPNYEFSHIYEGGYDVGFCNTPPTGTGPTWPMSMNYEGTTYEWEAYQEGDVPDNFAWTDQHGETVNLYSFCDKHVVISISAGWCGPCRTAAATLQSLQDTYWGQDVQFIDVIMQDDDGNVPDQAFLEQWASDYSFNTIAVLMPNGAEPVSMDDYVNAEIRPWDLDGYIPSYYHLDASVTIISADDAVTDPESFVN